MNDENNIELPKRVDEIPSSPEPNNPIVPEEPIINNPPVEPNFGQAIPENPITNDFQQAPVIPTAAGEPQPTNIFDQNVETNGFSPESFTSESVFEPIPDLELDNVPLNNNQEEVHTIITPEAPATPEEIMPPITEPAISPSTLEQTPVIENPPVSEPLEKKLVVEEPVQKEKTKGNPVVGFFALLLILAIILAAFYYFVKMDYIKLPDEVKNKIPFFSTTITTTQVNNNEEENDPISVAGVYKEAELVICSDVPTKLLLNDDETFVYSKLSLNAMTNNCDVTEIAGNYTASSGNLKLIPTDNPIEIITGTYQKTAVTVEISIPTDDGKTIILYDTNQR